MTNIFEDIIIMDSTLLSLILLTAILLVIVIVLAIKTKRKNRQFEVIRTASLVYKVINLENSFEKNLTDILSIFQSFIEAKEYSFYTEALKGEEFKLKAVLHKEDNDGDVSLVYSGFRKFAKEAQDLSSSLKLRDKSGQVETNNNAKGSEMTIPIKGGRAVIRIREISKVYKKGDEAIKIMQETLMPVVDILLKKEKMDNEMSKLNTTNSIMKNVPNTLMNHSGILKVVLGTLIKATEATGGLIIKKENSSYFYEASIGFDSNIEEIFANDYDSYKLLDRFFTNEDYIIVDKKNSLYYKLPEYFSASRIEQLSMFRVSSEHYEAIVGFWHNGKHKLTKENISMINMVSDGIRQAYDSARVFNKIKSSNVNVLKMICRTIDNLTPFTVGYSNMMSYFAEKLAIALGLNEREVEEISLAAYLSHIGVAVLSNDIHYEKIKYSQEDYETMKIHVDVGAVVVETSLGNKRVADYIKYHHERNDGNGYPEGIKGEQIPLGSKIISVVQFFLAKVRGRKYREPVSFDEALKSIVAASGSQIDSYVTESFVQMMNGLGRNGIFAGKSAFNCWELRGADNICYGCPAFEKTDKNCWELTNRNCAMHGSECQSCFIYTEYRDRDKR